MLVSNYLIHERHTIDTSLIQSRYVYDTFNRYTNDTWPCDRKYGNLVHVRYIDDMETIQKDDTSFSIRLRYWSKVCTIHISYNDTEYDTLSSKILDTYTIHERYKTHQNWLCIQSSIHCSTPTKAAILYRVCIEVYRTRICSMDTTVDTRSIRLRYTFDTLRYKLWGKCTPIHGENPPSSVAWAHHTESRT